MLAVPRRVPKSVLTVTPTGTLISVGTPGAPCSAQPLQSSQCKHIHNKISRHKKMLQEEFTANGVALTEYIT